MPPLYAAEADSVLTHAHVSDITTLVWLPFDKKPDELQKAPSKELYTSATRALVSYSMT